MVKVNIKITPGTCVGGFIFLDSESTEESFDILQICQNFNRINKPIIFIHTKKDRRLIDFMKSNRDMASFTVSTFMENEYEVFIIDNVKTSTFVRKRKEEECNAFIENGKKLAALENRGKDLLRVGDTVIFNYYPFFHRTITDKMLRAFGANSSNWSLSCTDEYLEKRTRELAGK